LGLSIFPKLPWIVSKTTWKFRPPQYFQVVLETFHALKMLLGQCTASAVSLSTPIYCRCGKKQSLHGMRWQSNTKLHHLTLLVLKNLQGKTFFHLNNYILYFIDFNFKRTNLRVRTNFLPNPGLRSDFHCPFFTFL
jgi:hypothetical protein